MAFRFKDFDLYIFDADGTLFDSVYCYVETYHQLFKKYGIAVPRAHIHHHIGMGLDKSLACLCSPEWFSRYATQFYREGKAYYNEHFLSAVEAFPGVRALLEYLRADGKKIALATMSAATVVDQYLSRIGGTAVFDFVTTSSDGMRSKPDPDIFLRVLEHFPAIPKERACVIGDSVWDMQAAAAIPVAAVGMLLGGYGEADLTNAGAVRVVRDCEALLAQYKELS